MLLSLWKKGGDAADLSGFATCRFEVAIGEVTKGWTRSKELQKVSW